jgi:hypothetical protein
MKLLRLPFGLVLARDKGQAILTAGQMFDTHLMARHIRNGEVVGEYDLGSGVVTTAGVTALADYFNNAGTNVSTFKYHDSGTGTTAAAIGDTDLQTPAGPTTRATGSQADSTNTYTTVGTIAYTGTLAITEWGLFLDATRGSDTMWDRKVFTAINVVNGDSIQFTYVLTITAGG